MPLPLIAYVGVAAVGALTGIAVSKLFTEEKETTNETPQVTKRRKPRKRREAPPRPSTQPVESNPEGGTGANSLHQSSDGEPLTPPIEAGITGEPSGSGSDGDSPIENSDNGEEINSDRDSD